jgi:hypothetical protein
MCLHSFVIFSFFYWHSTRVVRWLIVTSSAQNPFTLGTIAQLLMMEANDCDSELPIIDLISRRFDLCCGLEVVAILCKEPQQRFVTRSMPSLKPEDPFFKYEPTTLFVMTTQPDLVGNILLDFFEKDVGAAFTKLVNPKKFSLKVKVDIMDLDCLVKTRVYKEVGEKYAVEFQLRAGDSICFDCLYKRAVKYIGRKIREHSRDTLRLCD